MNRRKTLMKELNGKRDEIKSLLSSKEKECGILRFRLNALESTMQELGNGATSHSPPRDSKSPH